MRLIRQKCDVYYIQWRYLYKFLLLINRCVMTAGLLPTLLCVHTKRSRNQLVECFIADRYTLSPNKVIIIADTCGKSVILHLARQPWAKIRLKAMNMVEYGRHNYVVRLRYNNDKVDLVDVMEWTAESCHEAVFGLCRELKATNLKSAMAWAVKIVAITCACFLIGCYQFRATHGLGTRRRL